MRIGSLFSGAGGLDMAVEAAFAGHTVWHSEIDKAASKVLAYRWPDVPNLGSITEINWAEVEPVDVLCGGFPCQDVSAAGKRAGIKDGTRSGLWAVFAEAIGQLRPRFVVIENVRGLLSAAAHRAVESDDAVVGDGTGRPVLRAAGAVLGDLADLGYDAQWATVAAADVGAPHRRERVFVLATDASRDGFGGCEELDGLAVKFQPQHQYRGHTDRRVLEDGAGTWRDAPHSSSNGWDEGRAESAGIVGGFDAAVGGDEPGVALLLPTPTSCDYKPTSSASDLERHSPGLGAVTAHFPALLPAPEAKNSHAGPDYARMNREGSGGHDLVTALALLPTPNAQDGNGGGRYSSEGHQKTLPGEARHLLCTPSASDGAGGKTSRSGGRIDEPLLGGQAREMATAWGKYAPAIARWESLTRPAPPPTEPNKNGNPRLSAAFSEWLMGWPEGWVTDPAIGISRNDQLRIVGNGVCPQQATAALRMLLSVCEVSA